MAIEYRFDREKDILYVTLTEFFNMEDARQSIEYIVGSNEFSPHVKTLWDIRKVSYDDIKSEFFEKMISLRKKFPQRGKTKLAFVVDNDLVFGLMRMYEQMSAELPQKMMVFKDFEKAEKWLLS